MKKTISLNKQALLGSLYCLRFCLDIEIGNKYEIFDLFENFVFITDTWITNSKTSLTKTSYEITEKALLEEFLRKHQITGYDWSD